MTVYVGADMSKDKFDVGIPCQKQKKGFQLSVFKNNEPGIAKFISKAKANWHVILEATGVYSQLLSHRLAENGIAFTVIDPSKSKHFSNFCNATVKTDPQDAIMLSLYGKHMQPKPTVLPEKDHYIIKQKKVYIRHLQKGKQALANILHSLELGIFKDEKTIKSVKQQIKHFEKELKAAEQDLYDFTKETQEEQLKLLTSIKGIGPKTALALIAATNGFKSFQRAKQFSRYIGIAPSVYESGTSVRRKGRINRSGDKEVRRLLYICTWSAIRYNKACKLKYEQLLANGKHSMVALIAIMNKLVKQAFGVIQNGEKFDNDYEFNRANGEAS